MPDRKGAKLDGRGHGVRLYKALRYSGQGLHAAWMREVSFRLEIWFSLAILPLAFLLGETGTEKALLASSWLLVPIAELFNSGLEIIVDLYQPDPHPLAGQAKDIGSAAVFLALLCCALTWCLVLLF